MLIDGFNGCHARSLYHGRNTGKDEDGKKIWTRIGAAWPNKSSNGFNIT